MSTSKLNPRDIAEMRTVGKLAGDTLVMISKELTAGMTTLDINELVHKYTLKAGARPAPLDYKGFPKSVCTSINEVVCHGIPGPVVLKDGDIINVDVTSVLPPTEDGWHGDTSATFYIGEPSPLAKHVVEVAREALEIGLAEVKPGAKLGAIGTAIQAFVEAKGCSVVRDYCGHGIGRVFHMEPSVSHVKPGRFDLRARSFTLKKGMCFTIEPMVNAGQAAIDHLDDGWTVLTADGSLSAQFEHTIVVTKSGFEVLTVRKEMLLNSEDKPWARLGPLACPAAIAAKASSPKIA